MPRGSDFLPVSVDVEPDLVGAGGVVAVGIAPGKHIAAQLFIFVIAAPVGRLHIIGCFDQAGGQADPLCRYAFQMQGAQRDPCGQRGAQVQRARRPRQKHIAARRAVRPGGAVIGIGIPPAFNGVAPKIEAEGFKAYGIRIAGQFQPAGFVQVCGVQRRTQQNGRRRAAGMEAAFAVQAERRNSMHAVILKGQKVGGEAVAVPYAIHIQPLGGERGRAVGCHRGQGDGIFAAGEAKCRHGPEQPHLKVQRIHFIHARYIQAVQRGTAAAQAGPHRDGGLRHIEIDVISLADAMPACAAVHAVFIRDGPAGCQAFHRMQANGQHRSGSGKRLGNQRAGAARDLCAHLGQCQSVR